MKLKKIIEVIIFGSRWLLTPFYIVLILALGVYTYFDVYEFGEYIHQIGHINKTTAMLTFIELIDMTMIANLGKMIITGSYHSFVDKQHGRENEHMSSGMLKVKMATSLVGITSIGLLQRSVNIGTTIVVEWDVLYKLAFVHVIFLLSSIVLEVVDYMHEKSEALERQSHSHH